MVYLLRCHNGIVYFFGCHFLKNVFGLISFMGCFLSYHLWFVLLCCTVLAWFVSVDIISGMRGLDQSQNGVLVNVTYIIFFTWIVVFFYGLFLSMEFVGRYFSCPGCINLNVYWIIVNFVHSFMSALHCTITNILKHVYLCLFIYIHIYIYTYIYICILTVNNGNHPSVHQ